MAFQIIDDILDYEGQEKIGKQIHSLTFELGNTCVLGHQKYSSQRKELL